MTLEQTQAVFHFIDAETSEQESEERTVYSFSESIVLDRDTTEITFWKVDHLEGEKAIINAENNRLFSFGILTFGGQYTEKFLSLIKPEMSFEHVIEIGMALTEGRMKIEGGRK